MSRWHLNRFELGENDCHSHRRFFFCFHKTKMKKGTTFLSHYFFQWTTFTFSCIMYLCAACVILSTLQPTDLHSFAVVEYQISEYIFSHGSAFFWSLFKPRTNSSPGLASLFTLTSSTLVYGAGRKGGIKRDNVMVTCYGCTKARTNPFSSLL